MRFATSLALAFLLASLALAADRHVYLNQSGGGTQLDDCPNPSHNAKGTSNTDELEYCVNGSSAGKVIGTATGRVSSATCTGGGGVVTAVTNGVQADVDGDGTTEYVYGHPQACVWNMAGPATTGPDSCEIHAGEYKAAGARSLATDVLPSTCVGGSNPGTTCSLVPGGECTGGGVCTPRCDRSDCWLASVVATGYGPNMGTVGYGTVGNPAYLRGAVMNGSTDTWDSDGDKVPDTEAGEPTSYPAILSGDSDADAVLREATDCGAWCVGGSNPGTACTLSPGGECTGGGVCTPTCNGDAFYAVFLGCGNANVNGGWCLTTVDSDDGQTRPMLDSDANGTFDTAIATGGSKNVSHFTVKDLEFKNYSGGPATCSGQGIREGLGHLAFVGGGTTSGYGDRLHADHVYFHDGAYSNLCATEHYVAILGDDENWACSVDFTELRNSMLYLDNRFVVNDDCDASTDGASECGCSKSIHDNRIVVTANSSGMTNVKSLIRFKSVDTVGGGTRAKKLWIYNNEIVWEKDDVGDSPLIWNECIGKCDPWHLSLGQLSFHGNLFRYRGTSPKWKRFALTTCSETVTGGGGGTNWTFWNLQNTFDIERIGGGSSGFDYLCATTGAKHVAKGNAVRGVTAGEFNKESATLQTRLNNFCDTGFHPSCTQDGSARNSWWTVGNQNAAVHAGLTNYVPNPADVLHETVTTANNPCDPDADGVAGMDYDGDGDQDAFWYDLSGNGVLCDDLTDALSIGAIQPNNDPPPAGATPGALRGVIVRGGVVR